ncbi:hypothetical protein D3C86_1484030 [compost metagenome]
METVGTGDRRLSPSQVPLCPDQAGTTVLHPFGDLLFDGALLDIQLHSDLAQGESFATGKQKNCTVFFRQIVQRIGQSFQFLTNPGSFVRW